MARGGPVQQGRHHHGFQHGGEFVGDFRLLLLMVLHVLVDPVDDQVALVHQGMGQVDHVPGQARIVMAVPVSGRLELRGILLVRLEELHHHGLAEQDILLDAVDLALDILARDMPAAKLGQQFGVADDLPYRATEPREIGIGIVADGEQFAGGQVFERFLRGVVEDVPQRGAGFLAVERAGIGSLPDGVVLRHDVLELLGDRLGVRQGHAGQPGPGQRGLAFVRGKHVARPERFDVDRLVQFEELGGGVRVLLQELLPYAGVQLDRLVVVGGDPPELVVGLAHPLVAKEGNPFVDRADQLRAIAQPLQPDRSTGCPRRRPFQQFRIDAFEIALAVRQVQHALRGLVVDREQDIHVPDQRLVIEPDRSGIDFLGRGVHVPLR